MSTNTPNEDCLKVHSVSLSHPAVELLISEFSVYLQGIDSLVDPALVAVLKPSPAPAPPSATTEEASLPTVAPKNEALTESSTSPPSGGFFLATIGPEETPAGIAALRTVSAPEPHRSTIKFGELKRMFVSADFRRKGVAKALLAAIEKRAVYLGMGILLLETGNFQKDAMRFYEKNGCKRRSIYGECVGLGVEDGGISVCYEKQLN
jgi:GNAT superfamily N-acetyltransferase